MKPRQRHRSSCRPDVIAADDVADFSDDAESASLDFDAGDNFDAGDQRGAPVGRRLSGDRAGRPSGKAKDREDKLCGVCGDKALGFNFDAVSCESCKAFFRRNALKKKDSKCLFSGSCKIDVNTRRFCQFCRLKKCFTIGMKKEWILSEEEKIKRREKILSNKFKRGQIAGEFDRRNSGGLSPDEEAGMTSPRSYQLTSSGSHLTSPSGRVTSPGSHVTSPGGRAKTRESERSLANDVKPFAGDEMESSSTVDGGSRNRFSSPPLGAESTEDAAAAHSVRLQGFPVSVDEPLRSSVSVVASNSAQHLIAGSPEQQQQMFGSPERPQQLFDSPSQQRLMDRSPGQTGSTPSPGMLATSPLNARNLTLAHSPAGSSITQIPSHPPSRLLESPPSVFGPPLSNISNISNISHVSSDTMESLPATHESTTTSLSLNAPPGLRLLRLSGDSDPGGGGGGGGGGVEDGAKDSMDVVAANEEVTSPCAEDAESHFAEIRSETHSKVESPNYDLSQSFVQHQDAVCHLEANRLPPVTKMEPESPVDSLNFSKPFELNAEESKQRETRRVESLSHPADEMSPPYPSPSESSSSSSSSSATFKSTFDSTKKADTCRAKRLLPESDESLLASLTFAYDFVDLKFEDDPRRNVRELNAFINQTEELVRRIIKFAKKETLFQSLSQEDQIALLKASVFSIILLRSVIHYDPNSDALCQAAIAYKMEKLRNILGADSAMWAKHIAFLKSFHLELGMDRPSILLIMMMVLFSPDHPGVKDREAVAECQERYMLLLKHYLESTRSYGDAVYLFPQVIAKIGELRNLTEAHAKLLATTITKSPLEPLMVEIFDIKTMAHP